MIFYCQTLLTNKTPGTIVVSMTGMKHDNGRICRPQLLGRMSPRDLDSLDEHHVVEEKFDGWRCLASITQDGASLHSRQGLPIHDNDIQDALCDLPVDCLLDGELVALNGAGVSSLPLLVQGQRGRQYVAFDVLAVEGEDVRHLPLERRRRLLEAILDGLDSPAAAWP
jgi:ATP-dependent DNA ligase